MRLVPNLYYKLKSKALSNGHQFHVIAFLIRAKSIVNISTNSDKTDPCAIRSYDGYNRLSHLHAEMKALKKYEAGDILVVMRFLKNGKIKMAKPCVHCEKHILAKKVSEVWYSDDNGEMNRILY